MKKDCNITPIKVTDVINSKTNQSDSKKKLSISKQRKTDMILSFTLSLFLLIWLGSASLVYEWYGIKGNGALLKYFYEYLNNRWLVTVPICIVLGYFAFCWGKRIIIDHDRRCFRPLIPLIGLAILFYHADVDYAILWGCFDLRMYIAILLFALLCVMIFKIIVYLFKFHYDKEDNKDKEDKEIGFSTDSPGDVSEDLKAYADVIVKRMLATKIDEHSFAVGVTGEWGVGKTSFLDVIKKQIGSQAEVVEFNPWMCRSPEQVTRDFFSSLRHQLSSKYSTLHKPINEYASFINTIRFTFPSLISIHTSSPIKESSLIEKKRELSAQFAGLPRPVVVLIDDIDRLEREEIFEVLRLIRNTADFKNLFYIVAYDKEYVTSVLADTEIKDAKAYLEKIFTVEAHLPKVGENLVWEQLANEIDNQSRKPGISKHLLKKFDPDDKELILSVLNNYRRVKRFVRLYMLNSAYLAQQIKNEIKALDLFWLELLQMYDKNTYNILADNPLELLYINKDRYEIRKGILAPYSDKDVNKFTGIVFWESYTPKILDRLFGSNIKVNDQSICYVENYSNYFTLSLSPFRLSISEFKCLFKEGANPSNLISKWLDSGIYFSSVGNRLNHVIANNLDDNQLKLYIEGILYFLWNTINYRFYSSWNITKLLRQDRFSPSNLITAHNKVSSWFESQIESSLDYTRLCKLIKSLYYTNVYDSENRYEGSSPLVLQNDEIESLLDKLMNKFLDIHPELTALNLLTCEGDLATVFRNCCVCVEESLDIPFESVFKQVAFDTVINVFAKKNKKPSDNEYTNAMESLFQYSVSDQDNPDEDYVFDYMYDAYEINMKEYFGSSYSEKLEEFRLKCFAKKKRKSNKDKNTA